MSAPSPDQLARTIADIIDQLARGVEVGGQGTRNQSRRESVVDGYRWLHTAGYDRKVGGEATSTLCKACDGYGWIETTLTADEMRGPMNTMIPLTPKRVRCEVCTPTVGSDPTGDTIVARGDVMRALDKVGGYASVALEAVNDMISELQGIVGKVDQGVRVEMGNERLMVRAPKAEVESAKEAQQRRAERGEGYGAA